MRSDEASDVPSDQGGDRASEPRGDRPDASGATERPDEPAGPSGHHVARESADQPGQSSADPSGEPPTTAIPMGPAWRPGDQPSEYPRGGEAWPQQPGDQWAQQPGDEWAQQPGDQWAQPGGRPWAPQGDPAAQGDPAGQADPGAPGAPGGAVFAHAGELAPAHGGDQAATEQPGGGPEPEPVKEVPPAVEVTSLSLQSNRGPIFQDVNMTVLAGTVAAVVGPSGTGRTSLLLALTGRMKNVTGSVSVAGHSLAAEPAAVRSFSSIARIGHEIGPEPGLTVDESVRERCLLEKVPTAQGRERFATACTALELELPPKLLVGDVGGDDQTLLALALAAIPVSAVIVLDDFDRGVDGVTQYRLLDALARLAETGPAIVFTTTDRLRVAGVPVIVDLPLLSVQPVPVAPPAEFVIEDADLSRRELEQAAASRREIEQGEAPPDHVDADAEYGARPGAPIDVDADSARHAADWGPGPYEDRRFPDSPGPDDMPPDPPGNDAPTTVITPEDRR